MGIIIKGKGNAVNFLCKSNKPISITDEIHEDEKEDSNYIWAAYALIDYTGFDSNGVEQFDEAYDMYKGHFTSNHTNGENTIYSEFITENNDSITVFFAGKLFTSYEELDDSLKIYNYMKNLNRNFNPKKGDVFKIINSIPQRCP